MKRVLAVATFVCAGLCSVPAQEAQEHILAERYLAILGSNPLNAQARERLWDIYSVGGRAEDLVQKTRELSEINNSAQLPLAYFLMRQDRIKEAAEALQKLDPASLDAPALVEAGSLWTQLGETRKALETWEKAMEIDPTDFSLVMDLAGAFLAAGETSAARSSLERIVAEGSPPQKLEAMESLVEVHEAEGDLASAAGVAAKIPDLLAPGHWKVSAATARAVALGDRAGTLDQLEQSWKAMGREDPESFLRLAAIAAHRGDTKARLAWLVEACEANPEDRALLRERADIELALADFEAAIRSFKQLVEAGPEDPDLRLALAEAYALQGQEQEAVAQIDAIAAATGGLAEDRKLEILLQFNLRKPAEQLLRISLDEEPASVDAAMNLANFLLEEGRMAEAAKAFDQLELHALDPPRQSLAQIRVARFLKESFMLAASEDWALRARASDPSASGPLLLLADILEARGNHSGVLELLENSTPDDTALPAEDVDRRLFHAMQRVDAQNDPSLRNVTSKQFSETLVEQARSEDTPDAWLRASRWCSWVGDPRQAVECLRAGLSTNPAAEALLPPLADELQRIGDPDGAIEALIRLKKLRPDQTSSIDRQIAGLEILRGNPEAAVATLSAQLSQDNQDWSLLRELAEAKQATGNYYAALDVWLEAFDIAPLEKRPAILRKTLTVFSRLGLLSRAIIFLEHASQSFSEGPGRQEFFRNADDFAREHEGNEDWQAAVAARLESRPDSLAQRWSKSTAGQAGPLPGSNTIANTRGELEAARARAVEEGDWETAVRFAKRLAQPPGDDLDDHLALAKALEGLGRTDEARDAWRYVSARHNRSREALLVSAEALDRLGDTAGRLAALRAASQLGAIPPAALLELGRVAARQGNNLQALADFQAILAATTHDPSPERNLDPLPSRVNPETLGWAAVSESDLQGCRLLALREAGRLLADSPEKLSQIDDLGAANATEKAWALWAAGAYHPALDALEPASGDSDATAIFCLALEAGFVDRLAALLGPEADPRRWLEFLSAAKALVEGGWRPVKAQWKPLLAMAPPFVSLRLANLLAGEGAIRHAAALGVPDGLPRETSAEAWYRLAGWQLGLRQPDAAIESLDRVIALTPAPQSMESLGASAIRARWLLEPPEGRSALKQSLMQSLSPEAHPLAAVLFAALEGDRDAMETNIGSWIQSWRMAPGAGLVRALREGAQLQLWHLGMAARDTYRSALDCFQPYPLDSGRDSAALPPVRALEDAIVESRLEEADLALARFLVNEWVARGVRRETLAAAATRAAGAGKIRIAKLLYGEAFIMAPGDLRGWTRLLSLAPFPEGFPEVLLEWFLEAGPHERAWIPPETVLQLVHALVAAERESEALEVLSSQGIRDPNGLLIPRRTGLQIALGKSDDAVESFAATPATRGESTQFPWTNDFLAGPNQEGAAKASERDPMVTEASVDQAVADLKTFLEKSPSPEEALAFAEDLLRARQDLVEGIGEGRLRDLIEPSIDNPTLSSRALMALFTLSKLQGSEAELENQMRRRWMDGDPLAAEILIRLAIDQDDAAGLEDIVRQLLASERSSRSSQQGLAKLLLQNGHYGLAAEVYSHLDRDGLSGHALALSYAEALWKSGRRADAIDIAKAIRRSAAIDPNLHVALAAFHVSVDRPDQALRSLEPSILPPLAAHRVAPLRSAVARQFLDRERPKDAEKQIALAAQYPGSIDPDLLLLFLQSTGQFSNAHPGEIPFDLHPFDKQALLLAAAQEALANAQPDEALRILSSDPNLVTSRKALDLATGIRNASPDISKKFWDLVAQSPRADHKHLAKSILKEDANP